MDKRLIISVLAGIFSAGFVVMALIFLGLTIYPVDLSTIPTDLEGKALRDFMYEFALNLPIENYMTEIFANGIGLLAGLIVGRLIDSRTIVNLLAISGIMILLNFVSAVSRPHPSWFVFVDLAFCVFVSGSFIYLVKKRKKA